MSKVINIGGRLHSTEQGNVLAGANEILDDTKGKKQNVINSETDAELLRLENEKQNVLTFDNAPTENSNNPVKSGGVYAADKALSDAIEAILLLIPSAATVLNQLADKAFVNSSVSTNTATFRGTYNVVTDLELAYDATHEQIAAKLGQIIATADNNDYSFVQIPVSATSTNIRRTERYKYNGTAWGYEYDLNTSGFTAAQWEAINSGITALLVTKLSDLPTATTLAIMFAAKQDTLTFDSEPTALSTNPVTSGGIYTAVLAVATALTNYENSINALIPSEATDLNQLADKAYVLAKILDATPAFKGQFVTLAELQAVASPKADDLGIVRTKDNDGLDVFTFYQYLNNTWNVFFTLQHHPQTKPATTGTTGDYPYNGMGRIELQKNIVNGVNTLTQDMFYKGEVGSRVPNTNTIYVIQYDYELPVSNLTKYSYTTESGNTVDISGTRYYGNAINVPAGKKLTLIDTDNCILLRDNNGNKEFINALYLTPSENTTVYIGASSAGTFSDAYQIEDIVTIPDGCVLQFEGGSISGGSLAANGAIICGNPNIQCSITGIGNAVTHLSWFTKEQNKNTAFRRALDCAGSTTLDGDREYIELTQTVWFYGSNRCSLQNLNIVFTASANGQSMFLFNAAIIYTGSHEYIRDCSFVMNNTSEYNNVHCIHYRCWDCTVLSYISGVVVSGFSGYMFLCESYLQEYEFNRFKGFNVGGFISFNKEYGTENAYGDYAKGQSNIIRIINSGIEGSLAFNNTITDIVSLSGIINLYMNNCVFEGYATKDVNGMFISHYDTPIEHFARVMMISTWFEFVSDYSNNNNVKINRFVHAQLQMCYFNNISILGDRVSLELDSCGAISNNYISVQNNSYPTIKFTGAWNDTSLGGIFNTLRNVSNLIIDITDIGNIKGVLHANEGYIINNTINKSEYMTETTETENNVSFVRVTNELGYADNVIALTKYPSYNILKESVIFRLIYRLTPRIEVTAENVNTLLDKFSNSVYIFEQDGSTPAFIVGQSTVPSDNAWREIFVKPSSINYKSWNFNRNIIIDIACAEFYVGNIDLKKCKFINPSNSKLLSREEEVPNAGSIRPTGVRIGYEFFDTTLGKPIYAKEKNGHTIVWVDATGTPV